MSLAIAPLPFKPHRLDGLSERLLLSHYENNYGGALRRLIAIRSKLGSLDWSSSPVFELNGLKREELIALNSVVLHEAYFEALGEREGALEGELATRLERDFGSVERWEREFTALAKAQGGGSGWTLLSWSPRDARLVNAWAADHTHGIAEGTPVIALDMYEHAYHLDFGARAAAYVDSFMKNLHWPRVMARFERTISRAAPLPGPDAATTSSVETLRESLQSGSKPLVLDVCQLEDFQRKADLLPEATWRDPTLVARWGDELPRDRPVVCYCLYGFQVSQNAVAELRQRGVDARTLIGGIAAWRAIGQPTVPKA